MLVNLIVCCRFCVLLPVMWQTASVPSEPRFLSYPRFTSSGGSQLYLEHEHVFLNLSVITRITVCEGLRRCV